MSQNAVCPFDQFDPNVHDDIHDPYMYASPGSPHSTCSFCFHNRTRFGDLPSVDAIKEISEVINEHLPQETEWMTVWLDGGPYLYSKKLQDENHDRMGEWSSQYRNIHASCAAVWEPIARDVAKNTWVQNVVSKGTDHHRSGQIMKVLFDALAR